MNQKFNAQLSQAIKNLPESCPSSKVWQKIEGELIFREKLKESTKQLTEYSPNENSWYKIECQLNKSKSRSLRAQYSVYFSIAACLAILLVFKISVNCHTKETIIITAENADNEQFSSLPNDSLADQAIRFIDSQCKNNSYICENKEFENKRQQLREVNRELKKVNQVMGTLGNSPSIIQTKTKLENIQSLLIKDIVKQVTS